ATAPIAAAGLANETTRAWFWKAFRWFPAAAFTPLLVGLVTGVGMKMAEGVVTTSGSGLQADIGTAVPAIVLICVAVISPVALFKLLAFVDPGTSSGAAMRAGLAATGGIQGLLRGGALSSGSAPSSDAAQADTNGRSAGETSAETATTTRASAAIQGAMAVLGPLGQAAAAGLGAVTTVGAMATAIGSDMTNQEGVGNPSYYPDHTPSSRRDAARAGREQQGANDQAAQDDPQAPPPTQTMAGRGTPPTGPAGGAAAAGADDAVIAAAL
ncbi:MAG: hypothetical protein VB036_01185, partial [Propionicimonas sp.]|nr:hypothetical protein [Propionicimonas sp.]